MREKDAPSGVFQRFVASLRDNKKLELSVYAAIISAAVIIFAATGGISCGGRSARTAQDPSETAVGRTGGFRTESETESALEAILSGISGAGRVRVMIMFESTPELVPALDVKNSSGSSGESSDSSPAKSSSGGNEEPIVLTELCPKVRGVIVTAEGAGDIRVKTDLIAAVRALLGVDADRIGVFSMQHS